MTTIRNPTRFRTPAQACRSRALTSLAATAIAALPIGAQVAPMPETPEAPFVVHEWGTFTSMQGSDGHALEGLHHEEEALPGFVHDATTLLDVGAAQRTKFPASRVLQKMETPVLYFHSDIRREVSVDVYYPKGLLTQYYPAPHTISPPLSEIRQRTGPGVVDFSRLRAASIHWSVEVIPNDGSTPEGIPEVEGDDPWAFAREVDSAFVRRLDHPEDGSQPIDTQPDDGEASDGALARPANDPAETEHYIFYRGLSNQRLPIRVDAARDDCATLRSSFDDAIPMAVALEVDGELARFRTLGAVAPDTDIALELGELQFRPLEDVVLDLVTVIHESLVQEGLFPDEARAMVRTWSRQWFRSQGHRVIYFVPRNSVDQRLPLSIDPVPDTLVRVLVGRLEFLTPEREEAVRTALRDRLSSNPSSRETAERTLQGLGRFLEPHLRRVMASTDDILVLDSAREELQRITGRPEPEGSTLEPDRH